MTPSSPRWWRLLPVATWLMCGCGVERAAPEDAAGSPPSVDTSVTSDLAAPASDAAPMGTEGRSSDTAAPTDTDAAVDGAAPMDVAPGSTVAVAVGYGGRRITTVDGVTWTNFQQVNPDGGDDLDLLRGVGFGDGTFVAVGGHTVTSTDGVAWTDRGLTPHNGNFLSSVVWLDGRFIAAGGNGLRVRSLDHGVTWRDEAGYQALHYRDIAAGNGIAVAVGHAYGDTPGIIATTRDGVTWTEVLRAGATLNRIAFGNGVFVAVGGTGRCVRSTDGTTWDEIAIAGQQGSIVHAGTEFLVSRGSMVYRSPDGVAWTPVTSGREVSAWFAGHYLSFGWPATIVASTDLMKWTTVFNPGGAGFNRLVEGRIGAPSR